MKYKNNKLKYIKVAIKKERKTPTKNDTKPHIST
jgi:hypothetical protein